MKSLVISILGIFFCWNASAQKPEEKAIRQTIDTFFAAMKANDSTQLKQTLFEGCTLKSMVKNAAGEAQIKETPISLFIKSIGTPRPGVVLDERLLSYEINIDEPMAIAWTPYEFYVSNTFSHRGVNVFQLIKTSGGWRIASITDTRRK